MSRLSSHISLNKRQSRLLSSAVRHLRWASSTNLPPLPSQSTSNYFELFDLSASKFSVDRSKLKKKFLNWQRRVHPDTFAAAADGAEVEAKAKAWSELINHAYKTLDSDLDRALYMLEQKGMQISEDDGHDDMELLSLIMETRESLEEAVTQEHVDQIRHSNNQLRSDTVQSLDSAFNNQQWHQAKLLAIKLRYLNNVENVCREWMPGQEIVLQH